MITLGLTGNICSGKSTIATIFHHLGIPVFDSDSMAKSLYSLEEVREKVKEVLGKNAYQPDGSIDREFIRNKLFSDESCRKRINNLIHPLVLDNFLAFKSRYLLLPYIVFESALLFEGGLTSFTDKILLVCSPEKIRLERCLERSHLSPDAAKEIMKQQWDCSEMREKVDFEIVNDGDHSVLLQTLKIHGMLSNK